MEAAEVAAVVGKVAERLYAEEDYGEHEGITEESVAEVMNWLEIEIKLAAGAAVLALPVPAAARHAAVSGGKGSCAGRHCRRRRPWTYGRAGAPRPPAVPWPRPFPEPAARGGGGRCRR